MFKVINQRPGVISKGAVVNYTSTAFQQQELIEILKQHGRGLMDCAENSLARICKTAKEAHNVERGERIETGRGLIQEKQQLRFTRQFYRYCESLALLLIET